MSVPENIMERQKNYDSKSKSIESCFSEDLIRTGYFSALKLKSSPLTRLAYLSDIRDFLNFLCERKLISAGDIGLITESDLEQIKGVWVNMYLEALSNGEIEHLTKKKAMKGQNSKAQFTPVSHKNRASSVARRRASIISFFDYLHRFEIKSDDITGKIVQIKTENKSNDDIKRLQEDEVMKMLDVIRTGEGLSKREYSYWLKTKDRDFLLISLFITYGLRLFELSELNVDSFDIKNMNFVIYRKASKVRNMPLTDAIITAYNHYVLGERNYFAPEEEKSLFISKKGNRLSERQIRDIVYKYTSRSKDDNKGLSPHKLRATVATSLIERGVDIYQVQAFLDHEHVSTTEIYAKHREEEKANILKSFKWE